MATAYILLPFLHKNTICDFLFSLYFSPELLEHAHPGKVSIDISIYCHLCSNSTDKLYDEGKQHNVKLKLILLFISTKLRYKMFYISFDYTQANKNQLHFFLKIGLNILNISHSYKNSCHLKKKEHNKA